MKQELNHSQEEQSPEWDLLGNASEHKAGPMFSRNVMRSIRLETSSATPWWKRALTTKPLIGALSGVACALLTIPLFLDSSNPTSGPDVDIPIATIEPTSTPQIEYQSDLEMMIDDDQLAADVLIAMVESPEIFANEEVFEMIGL